MTSSTVYTCEICNYTTGEQPDLDRVADKIVSDGGKVYRMEHPIRGGLVRFECPKGHCPEWVDLKPLLPARSA